MECLFTLRFKLSAPDAGHDAIVERLGAAGCTDALVGFGVAGYVSLEFCREAASVTEAIRAATADVYAAVPGARLIAVELESTAGAHIGIAKETGV
ncbi:hypothetical protein RSP822_17045 [Ralstonia solanacearum]|uniref:hypothetical protein n=1 Tax=Ralstonia solanacearum TaxID=305 RepID=UPI000E6628E3|nr:hypothetical protein [Ralstonia solanacearum]RIJ85286.1 hypothetical protein RSP822_17045 [Ralstonia solanacearum]